MVNDMHRLCNKRDNVVLEMTATNLNKGFKQLFDSWNLRGYRFDKSDKYFLINLILQFNEESRKCISKEDYFLFCLDSFKGIVDLSMHWKDGIKIKEE